MRSSAVSRRFSIAFALARPQQARQLVIGEHDHGLLGDLGRSHPSHRWSTTGRPTTVETLNRDHLEAFLADLADRVTPATVAKHTAPSSNCSCLSVSGAGGDRTRDRGIMSPLL